MTFKEQREKMRNIDQIVRKFERKAGIDPPSRPSEKSTGWSRRENKLPGESDQ